MGRRERGGCFRQDDVRQEEKGLFLPRKITERKLKLRLGDLGCPRLPFTYVRESLVLRVQARSPFFDPFQPSWANFYVIHTSWMNDEYLRVHFFPATPFRGRGRSPFELRDQLQGQPSSRENFSPRFNPLLSRRKKSGGKKFTAS